MSSGPVIETELRVRYAETDAMGIVYHTNYIVWFEVGRGEYFWQQGMSYADWERQGVYFPVSEVSARFLAPACYGDLVTVRTWVQEVRSREVTFAYEVLMTETGQRLATGWTKHLCVNGEGRVVIIPSRLRDLLRPYQESRSVRRERRNMSKDDELDRIRRVKARHEASLLRKRNVVGVGVGRREVGGQMTDQACLVVMVERKVPLEELAPEDRIPSEIEGVCVDVQAVGRIKAL